MKSLLAIFVTVFSPLVASGEQRIELTTSEGKTIQAMLHGKGNIELVLCHGRGYKTGGDSRVRQPDTRSLTESGRLRLT